KGTGISGAGKMLALLASLRSKVMGSLVDTQGSPRGLGQPWAEFCNTVGVVSTRAVRGRGIYFTDLPSMVVVSSKTSVDLIIHLSPFFTQISLDLVLPSMTCSLPCGSAMVVAVIFSVTGNVAVPFSTLRSVI